MSSVNLTAEQRQARGRWVFCLLAFFFALPIIIVALMYVFEWHPQGASQGELLAPPRPILLSGDLRDANAAPLPADLLRDKWSMVYVTVQCEAQCLERLHTMRQLHASMAKDSARLQRILVAQDADWQRLQADYPDMVIINQPRAAIASLSEDLQVMPMAESRIYLIDPLANLMMSFPESVAPKAVRKDLVRLLKAAWAG